MEYYYNRDTVRFMKEKDDIYSPIPDQIERMETSPEMATPPVIEGLRLLIQEAIRMNKIDGLDGDVLLVRLNRLSERKNESPKRIRFTVNRVGTC